MKNNVLFFALCITLNVFSQDVLGIKGDYFTNLFFGSAAIESDSICQANLGAVGRGLKKQFVSSGYQLSDIYSFDFGFNFQGGLFQTDNDPTSETKIVELYSFQL